MRDERVPASATSNHLNDVVVAVKRFERRQNPNVNGGNLTRFLGEGTHDGAALACIRNQRNASDKQDRRKQASPTALQRSSLSRVGSRAHNARYKILCGDLHHDFLLS